MKEQLEPVNRTESEEGFEAGYWLERSNPTKAEEFRVQLANLAVKSDSAAEYLRGWDGGVQEARLEKERQVGKDRRKILGDFKKAREGNTSTQE